MTHKKLSHYPSQQKTPEGELVFGIHAIVELLKAGRRKLVSLYTTKPTPKGWEQIEGVLPKYPIAIQYVAREALHRIAQTTDHQGVIGWARPFVFRKKMFDTRTSPFLLLIDSVQDPRNVGAMIRSAYCTSVDGVILCKKNSAPLNATALKASAGLAEHMEIYQAASALSAAQELKAAGYTLYLATFRGENATTYHYATPLCLVIGSEGMGITKALLPLGTHITLPQRTADISYNASVAAGILLFLMSVQSGKLK